VPPKRDWEIALTLGTQPMTKASCTKEKILNPNPPPEEHLSNQEMLSFFCQEPTKEEELSYLKPSPQATCWSPAHTPSTESHSRESTQPTSLPPPPKSHWTVSPPTLMMPGSRDQEPSPNPNWKTPQKPDLKELNKASKPKANGKLTLKPPKSKSMLNC